MAWRTSDRAARSAIARSEVQRKIPPQRLDLFLF
jgi:hypothetical protein